jgi:hypothetical protein
MPWSFNRLLFAGLLICLHHASSGQKKRTPYAAWLFPAVSWHPAKDVRIEGRLGYNHYLRMALFYPQGFITLNKNVVLNPAYIYAVQKPEGGATVQELYLMNAVIFQAGHKNFLADDRNMLWNRFTSGMTARHYYRNRLRLTQSFKPVGITTRVYVYDEVFYLFNQRTLTRNRAAFGISSDVTAHIYTDVTYIRQWDRYSGNLNLFFITGMWQF